MPFQSSRFIGVVAGGFGLCWGVSFVLGWAGLVLPVETRSLLSAVVLEVLTATPAHAGYRSGSYRPSKPPQQPSQKPATPQQSSSPTKATNSQPAKEPSKKTTGSPNQTTASQSSSKKTQDTSAKSTNTDDDDDDQSKSSKASSTRATTPPAKRNSVADDDDDEDQPTTTANDKQQRKGGDSSSIQARSGPIIPETVAELLGRFTDKASKSAAAPATSNKSEAKPAGQTDSKSFAGVLAGAKVARRASAPVGNLALEPPVFKGGELLASNLSPHARHRAIARGFQIGSAHSFATLGALLTSLTLPSDMTASQARTFLQEIAPESSIGVNQRYRLYAPSNENGDKAEPESLDFAQETGGCVSERCYGAAVIGWKSQLAKCARDVRIGVIDTGIDMTHPALKRHRIYVGKIGPTSQVPNSELHGTGVLALLAGDTRSSTPGLIPGATFYVADIFFSDEKGQPVSTTMHLLAALEWMAQLDVHIVNLSLSGPKDALVQSSITAMSKPRKTVGGTLQMGTVFVAAAGNGGPGAAPSYPAAYSEVVAVTAVSKDLRSYRRANHGDYIDVAAPGVNIWTALPDGRQGFQSGTSFATPYMTAVVAAAYKGLSDTKSKEELLQRIPTQDLGAPGRDRVYGRGLVQAPAGCEVASQPQPRPRVPIAPWTTIHTPATPASGGAWAVTVARSPSH